MVFPYPRLEIDWRRNPLLADNVWNAQMAGHPKVLTYNGPDLVHRREVRGAAMRYEHGDDRFEIPRVLSRDEYPFACTVEGGGRSWVGHIPGRENSAQGGMIASFLRQCRIVAGRGDHSRFVVVVSNHPKGRVTNLCKPVCATCRAGCIFS